jgi:hypothetical protein
MPPSTVPAQSAPSEATNRPRKRLLRIAAVLPLSKVVKVTPSWRTRPSYVASHT